MLICSAGLVQQPINFGDVGCSHFMSLVLYSEFEENGDIIALEPRKFVSEYTAQIPLSALSDPIELKSIPLRSETDSARGSSKPIKSGNSNSLMMNGGREPKL